MSIRKCALAAAGMLAATTIAGVGLSTAGAAGNGGLPFITGGGHNTNNNSQGGTEPELTTFGGFNARAYEGPDGNNVYLADGEVQGRTSDNASHVTVGKVHGDVVCIADLGPADGNGGVASSDGGSDVWEIRFQIERSNDPSLVGMYGSLLVQDNGPHDDFADESFENLASSDCGQVTRYALEPHQGQITVHNA